MISYRGYTLIGLITGAVGILTDGEFSPISTAPTFDEAKGIIDAWKDAP